MSIIVSLNYSTWSHRVFKVLLPWFQEEMDLFVELQGTGEHPPIKEIHLHWGKTTPLSSLPVFLSGLQFILLE